MSQISLAYLYAKGISAPIIGASKIKYLEEAISAFDVSLSPSDIEFLEEKYVAHQVVGAI